MNRVQTPLSMDYMAGLVAGWEIGLSEGIQRGYQMADDDLAALQRRAVAVSRQAANNFGFDPYKGSPRDVAEGHAIRARLAIPGGTTW